MKEEWLMTGAIVPVDPETTAALVAEIKRLIGVVGNMALKRDPQSSMAWQEGHEAGRMTERMHVQAFMKQMFDAYSLSSTPGGLKNRGNK